MAKYSDIKGFTVQTLTSDTAPSVVSTGSWSSGGSLNTARLQGGAAGTYTAGLVFGGNTPTTTNLTEEYNGSAWSVQNVMGTTGGNLLGCGTQTAALRSGGYNGSYLNVTEEYSGASWATSNTMPVSIDSHTGSFGTQTAAYAVTGNQSPGPSTKVGVYAYNGASWTTGTSVNTAKEAAGGFGTTTSGLVTANNQGTEVWNGSAWTEVAEKNTARTLFGGASGTSGSDGIVIGGTPPNTGKTEFWDGSSWTELADMSTARTTMGVGNSSINALGAGGGPSATAVTEEWTTTPSALFQKTVEGQLYFNSTTNTFKETVTDFPGATWSSGGNMNTTRGSNSGFGASKDSALSGGGAETSSPPPAGVNTEVYNGSTWTEVNNLTTGVQVAGNFGTVTAGIFASGSGAPGAGITNVQDWNGTSWTEIADVNNARRQSKGGGTTTAALIAGGYAPASSGVVNTVESWNGNSWTETTEINTARGALASSQQAPYTDLVVFSGQEPANSAKTEIWNGSSWTETTDMNTARNNAGSSGTSSTSALAFFGQPPPSQTSITEFWNGSSWTELADGSVPRAYVGSAGSSSSAQINGGEKTGASPYYRNETEEFAANLGNKTITAS